MKFPHLLRIKNVSVRNEVLHQSSENMLSIECEALVKKSNLDLIILDSIKLIITSETFTFLKLLIT